MIVKNNARWRKVIAMGKRSPRIGANVGTMSRVNYDWRCKTLRVEFWRVKATPGMIAKWAKKGKRPPQAGKRFCHISPGKY
jgi:hypothetical protein